MGFLLLITSVIYFMLPAYFANMAPVIMKNTFLFLAIPIDGGRKLGGKRVLGSNKTWRGFILAIVFGVVVAYAQSLFSSAGFFSEVSIVPYDRWLTLGLFLGAGAILGDLIGSFFKRRAHVASGKPWIPWDQIDFIIGALLFSSLIVDFTFSFAVMVLVVSFVLDILVNHLAFASGMRGEKW